MEKIILSRSTLYNIEPIGMNTPLIESLSGYISRIADLHCITTGSLISQIITPLLDKPYLKNIAINGGNGFYDSSGALNGIGILAADFSDIMCSLTGRNDIANTTMITSKLFLPTRGLNKNIKFWCAHCYQEAYEQESPIYDQLLWSLEIAKECSVHRQPLRCVCPHCKSKMLILERKTKPGICSKCGGWLGEALTHQREQRVEKMAEEEIIGSILSLNSNEFYFDRNVIKESINFYLQENFEGNVNKTSMFLDIPNTTFRGWRAGSSLPPLPSLTKICMKLQLTILDFFNQKEINISAAITHSQTKKIKTLARKKLDNNEILMVLEKVIKNKTPQSISKVSSKLGCDRRLLARKFPDHCNKLKTNYTRWIKLKKRARCFILKSKLRRTFYILQRNGFTTSRRNIEKRIGVGKLHEGELQDYWKKLNS